MVKDRLRYGVILLTLSCIAAILAATILAVRSFARLALDGSPMLNMSLLPADHGLPNTIAGFQVLGVKTSENTACMPQGRVILVVKADMSSVDEMMSADVNALLQELERIKPDSGISWAVEVLPPYATAVGVAASNARASDFWKVYGCVQFGGPFLSTPATPP